MRFPPRAGPLGQTDADAVPIGHVVSAPSFLHRFSKHRTGLLGAFIVLIFLAAGIFGPFVAPQDPLDVDPAMRLQPPSSAHLLGTDELGRDVLSRLLYGARISIRVILSVVFVGVALGVPIGAISAYTGGPVDLLVQRLVDIIQAFPGILLLILIAALVGPSLNVAVVGLGILAVPIYARLIRGNVLQVKEFAYVESARGIGCRPDRILLRHILPNSIMPVIVMTTLMAAAALMQIAGMSFLGLGAQPPTPEWGAMLADGYSFIYDAPYLVVFPGLAIALMVLGLNLLGDGVRDALDPKAEFGERH